MTALKGWLTIGMAVTIFVAGLIAVKTAEAASKFKLLYQFNGDGVEPQGLIADRAGNLYGVTEQGGTFGDGTVFKLSPSSAGWNKTVLYNFQGPPTDIRPRRQPDHGRRRQSVRKFPIWRIRELLWRLWWSLRGQPFRHWLDRNSPSRLLGRHRRIRSRRWCDFRSAGEPLRNSRQRRVNNGAWPSNGARTHF